MSGMCILYRVVVVDWHAQIAHESLKLVLLVYESKETTPLLRHVHCREFSRALQTFQLFIRLSNIDAFFPLTSSV